MTFEQMCCPGPKPPAVPQQKHCLLIAASNPYRLPTPVIRPLVLALPNGQVEFQTEQWWLADAEAVAKAFPPVIISNIPSVCLSSCGCRIFRELIVMI